MAEGTMGVVLGPDLDAAIQLRWAARLAEARTLDLLVLQHVESREGKTVEISLAEPPGEKTTPIARQVREMIDASPGFFAADDENVVDSEGGEAKRGDNGEDEPGTLSVRLKEIRCSGLRAAREQLLVQIRKNKLKLCTQARMDLNTTDVDLIRERQLFLRYSPCEVVFCYGLTQETDLSRIVVGGATGRNAEAALRLGRDLAVVSDETMTAVRVNPSIGPDAEQVGARRLDRELRKALGETFSTVKLKVVVDDQIHRGLRQVWEASEKGIVILGASRHGILSSQPGRSTAAKLSKGDPRPVVVIVNAGAPIANRSRALLEGAIERFVPQIDRDNRISLVDRVQSSSNWDFDFFALMVLSTVIAAIGLEQNSAAVVIGAMLVAPLMTPLLGLGLALVQGNPVLARISVRAVMMGLGVSLLVGFLTGLLTPGFAEPTREMLGRGGPGLLDIFVAFASGLAAAYASSRPGLLAALPGVAIAAALVPPIATSGLALALGDIHLAAGALLLFVINMVTIVLATMVSFWVVGLRKVGKASRWSLTAIGVLLLAVLGLGVYLSVKPDQQPAERRISESLLVSMRDRLGDEYRLDSVAVAYDELGAQLNVRILGENLAPERVADDLRRLARDHFDAPVRVRLITEVQAGVEME
jgi:uncharacterized hydrophobic protein (TIGR00271 family)